MGDRSSDQTPPMRQSVECAQGLRRRSTSFKSAPGFFAAQGLGTRKHSFASIDATPCGFERVRINSIKSSDALPHQNEAGPPPLEHSGSSERQTPATIEKDPSYESRMDSETIETVRCSPRESPIWI